MSQKWLEELQEKVSNCWEWHSPALQIGFRYAKPDEGDDFWEIWAYPAVQEIVGGKEDGETVWSGFNFDTSLIIGLGPWGRLKELTLCLPQKKGHARSSCGCIVKHGSARMSIHAIVPFVIMFN